MSHICKTLLIRCMDFRLNNEMIKWIKMSALFDGKNFDLISLAGATKDLVSDDLKISQNFLNHIAVSIELHKAEKVIIFHHSDCGAYAKEYKFASPEEEKKKQVKDMLEAKKIITRKYREVEIFLVWGQLKDEEGKEIEFEVF
jgi:carbonic anhydrase